MALPQARPEPASGDKRKTADWRVTAWVMSCVQLLMWMGVLASNPLIPLFLENELGLQRGREVELWSGVIMASHFLTQAVFSPIWGNLADRYGRKVMVLRSTAAIGVFNLLFAFVQDQYQLLAVRLIMGVLSGFGATAASLVGATTPKERLGYALGVMATGQLLGVILGPLLGGILSSQFGYRTAFLWTGATALVAFLLTCVFVRENFVRPTPGETVARPTVISTLSGLARAPDLVAVFVTMALTQVAVSGAGPMTSLFVVDLGVSERAAPTIAGLAFSVTGLGAVLTARLLGRLSDRVGSKAVLMACIGGVAASYLPQAFAQTVWQFVALRFVLGLFMGGLEPSAYALVGRLAPRGQQSSTYGLTFSAMSIGNLTGPLASGVVAAVSGIRAVFIFTAVLVGLNAMWVGLKVRAAKEVPAAGG